MRYGRMQAACFISFRRFVPSSFFVLTSLSFTSFFCAYPAPAFKRRTARVVHSIGKTEPPHHSITLHGLLAYTQCKVVFWIIYHFALPSKKPQCSFISYPTISFASFIHHPCTCSFLTSCPRCNLFICFLFSATHLPCLFLKYN